MLGLIFDREVIPLVVSIILVLGWGGGLVALSPSLGRALYTIYFKKMFGLHYLTNCFFWAKNFQNLGWRVKISVFYKLLETKNYVKRKKRDKHLRPVQSITHLCNKFN